MIGDVIQDLGLEIGMYMNCTGPNSITVYANPDSSKDILLTVQPGQLIGQVHDFVQDKATGEQMVVFTSPAITKAEPWYSYAAGIVETLAATVDPIWWIDTTRTTDNWGLYGAVKISEIQANVSKTEITNELNSLHSTDANGQTVANNIKKLAKGTGQILAEAIEGLTSGLGVSGIGLGFIALLLWAASKSSIKTKRFSYKG
jgi:hypothetical protein